MNTITKEQEQRTATRVYEKVVSLIYRHGVKHYKKHGNFYIVQGDGEYLALDVINHLKS